MVSPREKTYVIIYPVIDVEVAKEGSEVCFVCNKASVERALPHLPTGPWLSGALERIHMK